MMSQFGTNKNAMCAVHQLHGPRFHCLANIPWMSSVSQFVPCICLMLRSWREDQALLMNPVYGLFSKCDTSIFNASTETMTNLFNSTPSNFKKCHDALSA